MRPPRRWLAVSVCAVSVMGRTEYYANRSPFDVVAEPFVI